ncbi:bifunctional riboflavin kinase/FAD synthetase [bacterium]|nr:bifunctional riboflavin kinase/FAD synthetase [bacterium]
MALYTSINDAPFSENRSVIIGTFDGVHHGHKQIIKQAKEGGLVPLVVTFTPHPRALLSPGYEPPLITTDEEKIELFHQEGVADVLLLPFEEYMHLTADQFLTKVLTPLKPKRVVVGFNFFFGRNQSGDANYLDWWCRPSEIAVVVVPPVIRHSIRVSSSAIREMILQGKIEQANDMLSRSHFYTGVVVAGKQVGNALGYSTLNITTPGKVLPPNGVYVSLLSTATGEWPSVTNIGTAPTISPDNRQIVLETHILNATDSFPTYGDKVAVQLLRFIRLENKFLSVSELQHSIASDVAIAKELFS